MNESRIFVEMDTHLSFLHSTDRKKVDGCIRCMQAVPKGEDNGLRTALYSEFDVAFCKGLQNTTVCCFDRNCKRGIVSPEQ